MSERRAPYLVNNQAHNEIVDADNSVTSPVLPLEPVTDWTTTEEQVARLLAGSLVVPESELGVIVAAFRRLRQVEADTGAP